MFKMNQEAARREKFELNQQLNFYNCGEVYNTGSTLMASNAEELIGYYLAKHENLTSQTASARALRPTGARPVIIRQVATFTLNVVSTPIVTPAQIIAFVRQTFMLNVSAAASVFRVSRPTLYQWESLSEIMSIRAQGDRQRLKEVYRLAQEWNQAGPLLGRWIEETLDSGKSVLDLLSAEIIDVSAVMRGHHWLSMAKDRLRLAENARSKAAANGLHKAFEELAMKEQKRREKSS